MTDRELMQVALDALEEYCEHNAMLRPIERRDALRAALAQPEQEPVAKMREMLDVQGRDGTWNYDPYFHGMYNGMEFMLAMVESREPVFRSSPVKWLGYTTPPQREWQGLTDEELLDIADMAYANDLELLQTLQTKLKEKNSTSVMNQQTSDKND